MTPAQALADAQEYKRTLVGAMDRARGCQGNEHVKKEAVAHLASEMNRVVKYEQEMAARVRREEEGERRLAEVRALGRAAYARGFEQSFGEAM